MRRLSPLLFVLVLVLVLVPVLVLFDRGSSTVRFDGRSASFWASGTSDVSCDVAFHWPGVRTRAYCVVLRQRGYEATGVSMAPSGSLRVCHDRDCTNRASMFDRVHVSFPVGKHVRVGPFRCAILHAGVRCISVDTHSGFLLVTRGVPRVLRLGASH